MTAKAQTETKGNTMIWTGRVLSMLVVLAMGLDGLAKLTRAPQVLEAMTRIGYPADLTVTLAILVLACTALYAIQRTCVLGAILLTAFLGGATAAKVRTEDPTFLISIVIGFLVWIGIFLRDERLRSLLPLRKKVQFY